MYSQMDMSQGSYVTNGPINPLTDQDVEHGWHSEVSLMFTSHHFPFPQGNCHRVFIYIFDKNRFKV